MQSTQNRRVDGRAGVRAPEVVPIRRLSLAMIMVMLVGAIGCQPATATAERPRPADPLVTRSLRELDEFTAWLDEAGARGYIGEVGWPADSDAAAWNELATAWYRRAAAADLEVSYWATGEWWGDEYPLSAYVASRSEDGGPLDRSRPQSAVIERQRRAVLRGVTVNGGEFGENVPETSRVSTFSNARPGVHGTDWHYDQRASFEYLARRGITTVRLPFRWERLQPRLNRPLNGDELRRLRAAVRRAGRAGLRVILDL
ncbi:MAG TPA: cellulase family glycosylhydrolase, partial [Euzebyales bacterium]|nr:cellulase family glycosylhydrolase [Euzebyales bacterium]